MIYLDNAATSFPKPEAVYRGMEAFARASGANPGRSGHHRAVEAEAMIDDTRRFWRGSRRARDLKRVVLGHNATDALNMAIKGVVRPGDHVITSVLGAQLGQPALNQLQQDGSSP